MGELTIRRNRGFAPVQYLPSGKAAKASGAGQSQRVRGTAGFTVSETLRQLMSQVSQAEAHTRESRRTLQLGEGVLAEVQDSLDRIAELARQSAGEDGADRAALQTELERLRGEIDRMLGSASAGDTPLFLDGDLGAEGGMEALLYALMEEISHPQEGEQLLPDWLMSGITENSMTAEQLLAGLGLDRTASGPELLAAISGVSLEHNPAAGRLAALYLGAVIAGGGSPEGVDPERALEGLRLLLERVAKGVPLDEAVEELTGGVFTSLADFEGQFTGGTAPGLQDFLTELLLSSGGPPVLTGPDLLAFFAGLEGMNLDLMMGLLSASQHAESGRAASPGAQETATGGSAGPEGEPSATPRVLVQELGRVQASGRDLSGVSLDTSTGVLTIAGGTDVTIRGTGEALHALQLTGSGTVTLQGIRISSLTVSAPLARIFSGGGAVLETLLLQKGVCLALEGSGLLRIGTLRGEEGSTLRLAAGAAAAVGEEGKTSQPMTVPVLLDGPASLAAQAVRVSSPTGSPLTPFDLVWKTLLPGWGGITSLAVDGRQAKLALLGGASPDPARLWLDKGDPNHGYTVHTLAVRGRDEAGQLRTRYAYLRWSQQAGGFEELSMYPNPFVVTGGVEGVDWEYEEEPHTLRILTSAVTAVSGGTGIDANQAPFSGRIALADGIGAIELALDGVVCRVSAGRAFSLGRENDVTLTLRRGSSNYFESGAGCAGISLGDGTSLRVDSAGPRSSPGPVGALSAAGQAGGAGIGRDSGAGRDRTCQILIRGGTVTASGAGGGAGIGAGKRGPIGAITITGGTVTATGGPGGGAGIGGALGASAGDISIRGGTVTAAALFHAAAIGAGVQGDCGNVLITGTARIVKAAGGNPGADIGACLFGGCGEVRISGGADIGGAQLWTRAGVRLHMGEDTVTLPQFRLSAQALQLDRLCVSTRERAQAARLTVDADRRWVARIQAAYSALYERLERSRSGLSGVHQYFDPADGPVRDTGTASTLLRDMSRSIPREAAQAMRTHGGQSTGDVQQLFQ